MISFTVCQHELWGTSIKVAVANRIPSLFEFVGPQVRTMESNQDSLVGEDSQGSPFYGISKSLSMLRGWFMDFTSNSAPLGARAVMLWRFVLISPFFVGAIFIKCLRRIARMRKQAPTSFEKNLIGAPPVEYEDENEQRNASLQRVWSTWMREGGHYMTSPLYKQVKCLLISWDKDHDDLRTGPEVCLMSE